MWRRVARDAANIPLFEGDTPRAPRAAGCIVAITAA